MVAGVLLGYVVTHRLPATEGEPAAAPVPTRSSPSPAEPPEPLVGRSGHGPAGVRVLLNSSDRLIVDLGTAQSQPVGAVRSRRGEIAYVIPARGALLAHVRGGAGLTGDAYVVRAGRPVRRLSGTALLPGRDATIVATTNFLTPGARPTVSGQSLDGRSLWRWAAPGGFVPARDTPHGLLLISIRPAAAGRPAALLVRRETGQVLRRFAVRLLALGDAHVAHHAPDCQPRCPLVVTRLSDGRQQTFAEPHGHGGEHGQFSPDGRWLAVVHAGRPGSTRPTSAAVLDLRTGAVHRVPGLRGPREPPPSLAWSPDSRWLIVAVRRDDTARIGTWRPDRPAQPVTVLPETFPGGAYLWIATMP